MAECDNWERAKRAKPGSIRAMMETIWRLAEIKKRRGIHPLVEQARQNWLRRRQVVPLRAEKVRDVELIA